MGNRGPQPRSERFDDLVTELRRQACTCPVWDEPDAYDGPADYADACRSCPTHGTAVAL